MLTRILCCLLVLSFAIASSWDSANSKSRLLSDENKRERVELDASTDTVKDGHYDALGGQKKDSSGLLKSLRKTRSGDLVSSGRRKVSPIQTSPIPIPCPDELSPLIDVVEPRIARAPSSPFSNPARPLSGTLPSKSLKGHQERLARYDEMPVEELHWLLAEKRIGYMMVKSEYDLAKLEYLELKHLMRQHHANKKR